MIRELVKRLFGLVEPNPDNECGHVSYGGRICRKVARHGGHCFTNGRPA